MAPGFFNGIKYRIWLIFGSEPRSITITNQLIRDTRTRADRADQFDLMTSAEQIQHHTLLWPFATKILIVALDVPREDAL